jgi:hypothetical protein
MSRYLKLLMIALLALVCIVPAASARPFVVVGGDSGVLVFIVQDGMDPRGLVLTGMDMLADRLLVASRSILR